MNNKIKIIAISIAATILTGCPPPPGQVKEEVKAALRESEITGLFLYDGEFVDLRNITFKCEQDKNLPDGHSIHGDYSYRTNDCRKFNAQMTDCYAAYATNNKEEINKSCFKHDRIHNLSYNDPETEENKE